MMNGLRARRGLLPAIALLGALVTGCGGEGPDVRFSEQPHVPDIATCANPVRGSDGEARPVVFVHGGLGSATQFQSQAIRFVQNGHPPTHLAAVEYDAVTPLDAEIEAFGGARHVDLIAEVIDACIQELRSATGSATVDLIGHSRGTSVSLAYLSDPQRRRNVRRYVNIDGSAGAEAPEGVPTLAIWDQRDRGPMAGAENVTFDQGHVEVATSAASFAEIYAFLHAGEAPDRTAISAAPQGSRITLRGRVQEFPANEGLEDGTVEIFRLDAMGNRVEALPEAVLDLSSRGRWGPFRAEAGARYELVIRRRDGGMDHHHFREPFVTDNAFVRLLTVPADGGFLDELVASSDSHANFTITRDKEFWGDEPGRNDLLEIDGDEITTGALAERAAGKVAIFAFDDGLDGQSDLGAPVEPISNLPFLLGVDLFRAASTATPPDATSEIRLIGRGTDGTARVVHVPRWPSEQRLTTVRFNDFVAQ